MSVDLIRHCYVENDNCDGLVTRQVFGRFDDEPLRNGRPLEGRAVCEWHEPFAKSVLRAHWTNNRSFFQTWMRHVAQFGGVA